MILEVGKVYEPLAGRDEGVIFDITGSGARLFYNYKSPTEAEIAACQSGQPFEIRFVELGGLIWVMTKSGDLNWTDAPYNPRASIITSWPEPKDTEGLALTQVVVDVNTAVVKSIRMIGLGNRFSVALLEAARGLYDTNMTPQEWTASIRRTMAQYSTNQLVRLARDYYRLK